MRAQPNLIVLIRVHSAHIRFTAAVRARDEGGAGGEGKGRIHGGTARARARERRRKSALRSARGRALKRIIGMPRWSVGQALEPNTYTRYLTA